MKVAVVQYDIAWESPELNKTKITKLVKTIDGTKVDWIIFPEASLTGCSKDPDKTAILELDKDFFRNIAKKLKCAVTFDGYLGKMNKLFTFSPSGELINEYAKIHLFSFAEEHIFYKAGSAQRLFNVCDFKVLPSICYDLRFSYLYWDNALSSDVFLISANWPESRREHWMTLLRARAIENQCFVIGVNRVGKDPNVSYSGDSMVIDPFGRILLDCGNREGVFKAELEKSLITKTRETFPFLNDRIKKS